ncbi:MULTISPECIES: DEAD/DEAH box helicase [unclassified Neptuniibacter]|uniref:DEAD/DEAH box helicase n=1 Tax=unclassified Neptuniibacter TaxID=2630693 RepID=UPI000C3D636A|nr:MULTISPECIES: DEAD/DEAH box helicase [unclassified Neptuniibacter]MAY42442.1 ATP-dependent RNA helicase [Oceanospirillaceae bacterium]|tara:strand:+ start:5078 stop:6880 length:1803 start_codon:yes stop_codon:yes gene_type:complete
MNSEDQLSFAELGLAAPVLKAIEETGYETPSPIQAASIPHLLEGRDLLGVAQTGTGKTAAFSLPLLSRLDLKSRHTQLLILAPTRELAIQVAEACQTYARNLADFHVLPIYGGQAYDTQLRQLKRGAQVVVGTPGRVMDHMRRGSLKLNNLQALVLDEADEMLRMGFIDDVEWVLEHTPEDRQIALFSATMPAQIKKVAQNHLNNPAEIRIKAKTATATTITQSYLRVSGNQKLDALTRILEMQSFDAMLIFVRTKSATVELSEKLAARGYASEALNGDISQNLRERTVDKLKRGQIDILVATDVVARGLDVERISHVLNYDIPYDTESYIHRIGRTGRAGREGEAILFVSPREQRMLKSIERATRQQIDQMQLPSTNDINEKRVKRFVDRITETIESQDIEFYKNLLTEYQQENDTDPLVVASALAHLLQGKTPLLMKEQPRQPRRDREERGDRGDRGNRRQPRGMSTQAKPLKDNPDVKMQRYKLNVGHEHGVAPKNIVGAIANEADLDANLIGSIEIYDDCSTVDLPTGMPKAVVQQLRKAVVCGQRLNIQDMSSEGKGAPSGGRSRRSGGNNSNSRNRPPRRNRKDSKDSKKSSDS